MKEITIKQGENAYDVIEDFVTKWVEKVYLKNEKIKSYPPYVAVLMGAKYFNEKEYSNFIEVFEFWGDHCSYTSENDYWEGETHFTFYGFQPIDVNFEFKFEIN